MGGYTGYYTHLGDGGGRVLDLAQRAEGAMHGIPAGGGAHEQHGEPDQELDEQLIGLARPVEQERLVIIQVGDPHRGQAAEQAWSKGRRRCSRAVAATGTA